MEAVQVAMRRQRKKTGAAFDDTHAAALEEIFSRWIVDMETTEEPKTAPPRSKVVVGEVRPVYFGRQYWCSPYFDIPRDPEHPHTVVLGDSNVSRMLECRLLNTVAYSFGGARFPDLLEMLSRSPPQPDVTNTAIYCGTNDVASKLYHLHRGINSIPATVRELLRVFPNATVHLMGIHVSSEKDPGSNAGRINNALTVEASRHPSVDMHQPFADFEADPHDPIHFSREGAKAFGQAVTEIINQSQ